MDSYKHSCPFCSQRIEYTLEYCGQQMKCPSCDKVVFFPAIPPGQPKLRVPTLKREVEKGPSWFGTTFAKLAEFKHWKAVALCATPFVIVIGLVMGARHIEKNYGSAPAAVASPIVQADPEAWKKLTELTKADQTVQEQLRVVNSARVNLKTCERRRTYYSGQRLETSTLNSLDNDVAQAGKALDHARVNYNAALLNYQQLGGTVDYNHQLLP